MSTPYEIVTQSIIERLEAGTVPWRKPWSTGSEPPLSLTTGHAYRGLNVFLLASAGYMSPHWATYKQAQKMGGQVRKGERGIPVVFWKWPEPEKETDAEGKKRGPILRYFRVFNAEQCEGLEEYCTVPEHPAVPPIEAGEKIAAGYADGPSVSIGGGRAFYEPSSDSVTVPNRAQFDNPEEYYSALFHELAHSTGHRSRLDRDGVTNRVRFGSHEYSREELVAEMAAAMLCGECGLAPATIDNSAAYVASWLKVLRSDARAVVAAGSQAQRAADWIRGIRKQTR